MTLSFNTVNLLFGPNQGFSSTSLLGAVFPDRTLQPTVSPAEAIAALETANRGKEVQVEAKARERQVQKDLKAFETAIRDAGSVEELLENDSFIKVALTVGGLADQVDFKALVKKALTSDPTDPESLANQLKNTNSAWLFLANELGFALTGLATVRSSETIEFFKKTYTEQLWRDDLERRTPGLNFALQFKELADSLENSLQILGDPIARQVVTKALGIPDQIAVQSIEAQQRAIDRRLDVSRLKDPEFVENFIRRYLIAVNGQDPFLSITA